MVKRVVYAEFSLRAASPCGPEATHSLAGTGMFGLSIDKVIQNPLPTIALPLYRGKQWAMILEAYSITKASKTKVAPAAKK